MTTAGEWKYPTRLHLLAIVGAVVLAIAALAAVIRHSLNEWTCKMNWSAPCASGTPLDLSPPSPKRPKTEGQPVSRPSAK
jgi:hypothetical protein